MNQIKFEKREVTRPASTDEKADLTRRLLEVLSSIDSTKEEAKAAASEFRGIIADLHKREIGLRFNLETSTVTQEIDVHAVADEATGMMLYFDRNGIEVMELRHELSTKQREEEALRRQLDMFGKEPTSDFASGLVPLPEGADLEQAYKDLQEEASNRHGDIFNTSPLGATSPLATSDPTQAKPTTATHTDETGTDINAEEQSNAARPEPTTAAVKYDPTPEQLDDMQRDHNVRNGIPEREQPMSIQEAVQKFNDILNGTDDPHEGVTFDPADLDQLQKAVTTDRAEVAGTLPPKPEVPGAPSRNQPTSRRAKAKV